MDESSRTVFNLVTPPHTQPTQQGSTRNRVIEHRWASFGAPREGGGVSRDQIVMPGLQYGRGHPRASATGPQTEESRLIREAAQQRLYEQRLRERQAWANLGVPGGAGGVVQRRVELNVEPVAEERRGPPPSSVTGPQSEESRAIREESRQRLQEQRRREREVLRNQRQTEYRELETPRWQWAETITLQHHGGGRPGWGQEDKPQAEEVRPRATLQHHNAGEVAQRRQELAEETGYRRQQIRSNRLEQDLAGPGRRRVRRREGPSGVPSGLPGDAPSPTSAQAIAQQREALGRLVQGAERAFQEKRAASDRRDWCNPIPAERKVDTVQGFLKAFHDESNMEIGTCSVCYMKKKPRDLEAIDWKRAVPAVLQSTMASLLAWELRELTPLEEKLISLNAAYGFITKFSVQRGQQTGPVYRKHMAGHITVFPNDVESLVTKILPHPLVSTLDQVHVIWTGVERPTPRDVSKLLSVRPGALRAALRWLKLYNPLYGDVTVDEEEMAAWTFEGASQVPVLAYQRIIREDETAEERIRTAHIVPPADRGQEIPCQQATVEDIVMQLVEGKTREDRPPERVDDVGESSLEEATAAETSELVFELRSSAMFPIDDQPSFSEQDKLEFISSALRAEHGLDDDNEGGAGQLPSMQVHGSSERPFIWVSRGGEFADTFSPDFFPKTFPSCFPHGRGGPRVMERDDAAGSVNPLLRDMTLETWSKIVLQRHGGHCAQHPAFSFLVSNMLVRSRNLRVAQGRLKRSAFQRVAGIHRKLDGERIRAAQQEMFETGKTTDSDVIALMKELSLYGSRHPLSNETRLSMRKKLRSMIIAIGLTAIWLTVNPNDINNPVKLKLAAYRGRSEGAAKELLQSLCTSLRVTTLSVHDPLSSTLFFFREILLFFKHYVRVGEPSVFGQVSHYYATVETNDRGALHLHGLLWLEGNLAFPDLARDLANPTEGEYRLKVKNFVDDVFTETLNEPLAQEAVQCGKKTTVVEPELMRDADGLLRGLQREANFIASRCQVHHHSATCVKYSIKRALKEGVGKCKAGLCRFGAPWRLVPATGFTEDGLLEVMRDHEMVNRYNQSMAIGLRHNTDISLVLTRKKGLALMHYICNYATKLNAPMWKRLAAAAELSDLINQKRRDGEEDTSVGIGEETKSFLVRVANRIFTSRELSQPEVLGYLLGFGTDFTNVTAWTWVHLNTLYWACARGWLGLREALSRRLGREPHPENMYCYADGFKLACLEAYKHRGPILRELCFYDYMAFVVLKKERQNRRAAAAIPFSPAATVCTGWVQCLRQPGKTAVPVLDGRLTDEFGERDENFVERQVNAVLHLSLFVPWENFQEAPAEDIPGLWRSFEEGLAERPRSYVRNIALLRVSADDARADRKLRSWDQDFEETVDADAFGNQEWEERWAEAEDGHGHIESKDCYDAFMDVLSAVRESEIRDMPVALALRRLDDEARTVEGEAVDNTAAERGRQFYTTLQDIQESPFRGMGLLSQEEIDAILRVQKKEDTAATAFIQGGEDRSSDMDARRPDGRSNASRRHGRAGSTSTNDVGSGSQMRLEVGPYTSYVDVGLAVTRLWTLNKLQSMAVLLPAVFLDERCPRLQEEEGKQHFQYVGGEGGTGKSRVIHAIKDMFRLKDCLHTLLLTGANGNAAALIGGLTLHSATNIGFEGRNETTRNVSEEEKLRWKNRIMLVIDEISQVGGLTLASVDSRLRLYRDDPHRPFGGIPIVIFFGDFFQFDPVRQTSLLLPEPKGSDRQRPESLAKHIAAHRLFLQFTTVVILREQVRAAGCARLRGFLRRLRSGQQTELDFQRLCRRVYNRESQPSFADGLRAITPLNQDRWNLNMAAVVQWARGHGRHISIFVAKHDTERGGRLRTEELRDILRQGDDSHLPTPGLFFYAQGMPVVVTRNQLTGLKLVNGAPFQAIDIIPDLASGTIALAGDVTLHLGPPEAVLLQSDDIADMAIPGLPQGTLLVKSKTVAIPDSMRGKAAGSRGKPGFERVTHRTGPLCTPAFAMTDQKSQGKQFSEVLLNLKGGYGSSTMTRPSFMSLYVQLSRAETWEGLHLLRKPARSDFVEPKNVLDEEMRQGVLRLERLGNATSQHFERAHRHERWFQDWEATAETSAASVDEDEEDASVWGGDEGPEREWQ